MTKMISIRLSDEQFEARLRERFRGAYTTPPTKDEREMYELMDDAARLLLERME